MEYHLTDEDYTQAEHNGIPKETAYRRFYYYGWPKDRSLTQPMIKFQLTPQELATAEENGIPRELAIKRVYSGWSKYNAITRPTRKRIITKEIIQQAEANGIGYDTLRQRIHVYKWTVERAVTEPIHTIFRRKHKC